MRFSRLFTKILKETPKDADNVSSAFLMRAGFIDKLSSGVFSFLPLGFRVLDKIATIIRKEMNDLGGQEILMPAMIPKDLWEETGRWTEIDPPLFRIEDRHRRLYGLGSTHEEVVVDLARTRISSYQELPFMVYQIQDKFRNEMRSTGGLLRVREFWMKDAYSFHASAEDLDRYYEKIKQSYLKIFSCMELLPKVLEASSGTIGGKISNEFAVLAATGEDTVIFCKACDWAANIEVASDQKSCPECKGDLLREKGIEVGHIFKLGIKYSEPMKLFFTDQKGEKKPVFMGCYGIGLGRLMATVVEASHDEKGIIWPESIAPYQVHLLSIGLEDKKVEARAEKVYNQLVSAGIEVLYDDREESAGIKFAEADLIGIPKRLVISPKTLEKDSIEIKKRSEKESKLVKIEKLTKKLLDQ